VIKECEFRDLNTSIRTYIGPFKIYNPEEYLRKFNFQDSNSLYSLLSSGNIPALRKKLDADIENGILRLGKNRSKRYFDFWCDYKDLPKLRMKGRSFRYASVKDKIKHISKTAILKRSKFVYLKHKSEPDIMNYLLSKGGKDRYNLSEYIQNEWVDLFLSGKMKKSVLLSFLGLRLYISIYVSRKQGWI